MEFERRYSAMPQLKKAELIEGIGKGKLKYKEEIEEGIENTPRAFMAMLKGRNTGKQLVKVADPG